MQYWFDDQKEWDKFASRLRELLMIMRDADERDERAGPFSYALVPGVDPDALPVLKRDLINYTDHLRAMAESMESLVNIELRVVDLEGK